MILSYLPFAGLSSGNYTQISTSTCEWSVRMFIDMLKRYLQLSSYFKNVFKCLFEIGCLFRLFVL